MASETIGQRIRRYREEAGMSASELATKTGLSKSYISELESAPASTRESTRGPSAAALYTIAKALNVAMADLLGKPVLVSRQDATPRERPRSLTEFAHTHNVPETDMRVLERIEFRGEAPKTSEAWYAIYQAIKHSTGS